MEKPVDSVNKSVYNIGYPLDLSTSRSVISGVSRTFRGIIVRMANKLKETLLVFQWLLTSGAAGVSMNKNCKEDPYA